MTKQKNKSKNKPAQSAKIANQVNSTKQVTQAKPVKDNQLAQIKPDYAEFYRRTLPSQKHHVYAVLEIGFNMDSLKSMAALFPNALIHTLDMFAGKEVTKEDVENAGFFVYAMDEKVDGQKGLSLAAISTKFDIIIDRGVVYNASELMVFNQLYTNNMNENGCYYIEALDTPGKDNLCMSAAKAIFDADRSFSNKCLTKEVVSNLIDITEWCDMDPTEKIAVFKRRKDVEKHEKNKNTPSNDMTSGSFQAKSQIPVVAFQKKSTKSGESFNPITSEDLKSEIEAPLILPKTLTIQFFDKAPTVVQNPVKFGHIKKDIFASFFGKQSEAPAIYEMYGSNGDFFFADIARGSDRYYLEMARSFFTICHSDIRILDALLNDTIPVIINPGFVNIEFWDNNLYPCLIICRHSDIQFSTGNVYRNPALMNKYVVNGRKLLKKLVS